MSDHPDVRGAALRRLPVAYSRALRMRDAGESEEAIADALGIERVAVGPLLRVAEAKLEALLEEPSGGSVADA